MAKPVLTARHFVDETAAFAYVEARFWPEGPTCPHCGATSEHIGKREGKSARPGLYKCYACRKELTVRIGTIFESSHLPLHLWLQVMHLMCASKKGISTRQIQRMLNCSMKTAWFLGHRIREVMAPGANAGPLGGAGKIVEADETYLGVADGKRKRKFHGMGPMMKVMSLVERGGQVRSQRILEATKLTARNVLGANIHPESILHTDGSSIYREIGVSKEHEFVDHSISYVGIGRKGRKVHTNTLEGFFSVFKRGMVGTYQHCSEAHLQRYLNEFDFRQNTRAKLEIDDVSRAEIALKRTKGKRLTYETAKSA